MDCLTERQAEVLTYLRDYTTWHDWPPTVREIQRAIGVRSTAGVAKHLDALERKGLIESSYGRARSIRLR